MQTVETTNEGLKRAYTMTITAAEVEARIDAEVKKIAPQVRLPGFRPGKVPANLVKKMHKNSLMQDALNSSIQEGVQQALADNKLRPATQPHVHLNHDYTPGKDAVVDFHLEILPDIAAPSLAGLKLERLQAEPTAEEIDAAIGRLADSQQSFETAPKSHKAASGDQVIIDFEGKVGGVPFDGGKGDGMAVVIGSGQLIPGFEDQLIGLKLNDEAVINVTFPADYSAANLQGKAATFDIVVGEIKRPIPTKIDDAMAKGFGLEGMEQLRELMKGQVEQELNGLTRTYMKRQLLDQLASNHDFEVPPSMVEAEFNQIWQQLEVEAEREENPETARAEMEAEKADYRDIAVRRVRLGLLLSEIGQSNGVEVSSQEMNMLIQQAAQQYPRDQHEAFVKYLQDNPMAAAQLRAPLFEDKVVDFLFGQAEVTDRSATREELEAAIEAEPDERPATKSAAKKPASKKPTAKKPAAEKSGAKKTAAEKPLVKAAAAKKTDARKMPVKKPPVKKTATKEPGVKKTAPK